MEYTPPDGGGGGGRKALTNAKNGKKMNSIIENHQIISVLLGDPNQFDDVALQNGGDSSWQLDLSNDLAFKRQNKPRSTKPQDFQVGSFFRFPARFFSNYFLVDSNKSLSSTSIRW